jgi:hypothetical protein
MKHEAILRALGAVPAAGQDKTLPASERAASAPESAPSGDERDHAAEHARLIGWLAAGESREPTADDEVEADFDAGTHGEPMFARARRARREQLAEQVREASLEFDLVAEHDRQEAASAALARLLDPEG